MAQIPAASEAETASTAPMTKTGQGRALMSVPRLGIAMTTTYQRWSFQLRRLVCLPDHPCETATAPGVRWLWRVLASEHLVGEQVIESREDRGSQDVGAVASAHEAKETIAFVGCRFPPSDDGSSARAQPDRRRISCPFKMSLSRTFNLGRSDNCKRTVVQEAFGSSHAASAGGLTASSLRPPRRRSRRPSGTAQGEGGGRYGRRRTLRRSNPPPAT